MTGGTAAEVAPVTVVAAGSPERLPPLAGALYPLLAGYGALICATQDRYPLAGDEYFFLAAGDRPAWGYSGHPPLVPLLARLADAAAPDNRLLLRLPMLLAVLAAVFLCAVIARELGGGRAAQLLAAGSFALSPYALVHTRWLTTDAVDLACWAFACWLLVRWVRTRDDRIWWGVAACTALALQGKYLVGVFWVVVALAVLVSGPRDLLRRPLLPVAALVAAAAAAPSLAWQAANGFPQADSGSAIQDDVTAFGGWLTFVPGVVGALGLVAAALFVLGIVTLLRERGLRFLGLAVVGLVLLVWALQLRRNYLGGVYPVGIAAGAVQALRLLPAARRWPVLVPAAVAGGLSVLVALPGLVPVGVGPLTPVSRLLVPQHRNDWPGLARAVASVAREVPPAERDATVVVAGDYWRSSVLERLREEHGLPPVYGDMQGAWFFGPPPASTRAVVFVGPVPDLLRRNCSRLRPSRTYVDERTSPSSNEPTRMPISICTGLERSMPELWPGLHHVTLRT